MEEARQHPAVIFLRQLFLVCAAAGSLGFLGGFFVNAAAQGRLEAHPEYSIPSIERPVEISVKGLSGFVERGYAARLQFADESMQWFWIAAAIGFLGWFLLHPKAYRRLSVSPFEPDQKRDNK